MEQLFTPAQIEYLKTLIRQTVKELIRDSVRQSATGPFSIQQNKQTLPIPPAPLPQPEPQLERP